MYRLLVASGDAAEETRVAIIGAALFTDALEMQAELGALLERCEHLVVDIARVEELDLTFRALLCSLHRQADLMRKRLTVLGVPPCRDDQLTLAGLVGCRFQEGADGCRLWSASGGPEPGRGDAVGTDC